jgi:RNA polymerase sigma-70 factor (ECF subfamily)
LSEPSTPAPPPASPASAASSGTRDGVEDAELLRRAAGGDDSAFDALIARHGAVLLRFARRVCDSPTDGEDALQSALLSAWRAAGGFRGDGSARRWLFTTVVNACRHHHRLRVGQPRRTEPIEVAESVSAADSPADRVERSERARTVEAAFESIDPEARAVLLLRDVEGLSGEEAAELLGISLAAMKSRLHRARLELKRRFDALERGEPRESEEVTR